MDDIDLSGLGMVGQLIDINQIEVFKGPQSSVFGSNAIGGVISLRSGKPDEKNAFRYSFHLEMIRKKELVALLIIKSSIIYSQESAQVIIIQMGLEIINS